MDRVLVCIRQALYEGIAKCCLREAWKQLNEFRTLKRTERLYRGKNRLRKGVPHVDIATVLDRDQGEIARWFRGLSPNWSNLIVAMTALDAEWGDLGIQPSKKQRRIAGWMNATRCVNSKILNRKSTAKLNSHYTSCLDALFQDEEWPASRRFVERRSILINKISRDSGLSKEDLDKADNEWGDAWALCLEKYGSTVDPRIWNDEARP